jgi:hypothetical protein
MGKIKSFFNVKNIINVWAYPKWWAHPFLSCFIKKKKKFRRTQNEELFFRRTSIGVKLNNQAHVPDLPFKPIPENYNAFHWHFIKTNPPQAMRNAFHWLPPSCYLDFARIQCIDPSKSSSSKHVWIVVLASS